MRRATTPTHSFTFPCTFDMESIDKLIVTYMQKGRIILEKEKEDVTFSGHIMSYHLTQEETLLFQADATVYVQVRVLDTNGNAMASDEIQLSVERILNTDVLENTEVE